MELIGILLAIPVAVIISVFYVLILSRLVDAWPTVAVPLRVASWAPIVAVGCHLTIMNLVGVLDARTLLGTRFDSLQGLFVLIPPALANVMLLYSREHFSLPRAVFTMVAISLVGYSLMVLGGSVNEVLYGPDGIGGPFGPAP